MAEIAFDHERLDVYRVALEFAAWTAQLLRGPLANCRVNALSQLDRASTSIALNLAEGNGKRSPRDRSRYLDIARGSAFECAAALDILVARGALLPEQVAPGKQLLHREVGMLFKLATKLEGQAHAEASGKT